MLVSQEPPVQMRQASDPALRLEGSGKAIGDVRHTDLRAVRYVTRPR